MSEISNIGNTIYPSFPYTRSVAESVFRTPAARAITNDGVRADRVELFGINAAIERAIEESSLSIARTRAIRAEIENGTFETPVRIDGTVARLLDVIA